MLLAWKEITAMAGFKNLSAHCLSLALSLFILTIGYVAEVSDCDWCFPVSFTYTIPSMSHVC